MELERRLRAAGVPSVAARTFHSTGWWLMREEGLARRNGIREASFNQWRRLCALALRETGTWLDPADARAAIGTAKLGLLATPREFAEQAHRHPDGETVAYIYELYERQLAEDRVHDFDDLVLGAVRALREDEELRRRWQSRFGQVLVDEYQDIEPAQELLVRILGRRRTMASSAWATRTRPCTDGARPACAGFSTSTSPTRGSSGSHWRTTTVARPTSSKRPGG